MKTSFAPLLGLALAEAIHAHYVFGRLIFDGQWSDTWEYVREITGDPTINNGQGPISYVAPIYDPELTHMRCGRNATLPFNNVKTATVQAGDTIGMGTGEPSLVGGESVGMYHPGYATAWLSKSPTDDLDSYAGDGDWFKILQTTGITEQSLDYDDPANENVWDMFKSIWGTFRVTSWNFTIPETTPPGKYLLRFEHVFPNPDVSQFFVNCAQIEVVNPTENVGTPGPLVQIPGHYEWGQPDVYFTVYQFDFDIDGFEGPTPPVWSG